MNVKLLTGNALHSGSVIWWTGNGWAPTMDDAAGLDAEEGAKLLALELERGQVNDLALVDARAADAGGWWPLKIRERIRGLGPTVRTDLVSGGETALRNRL